MVAADTHLGNSGLALKRLGFGCEQLGGYQWGSIDPVSIAAAVERAVDLGVGLFDTADCYGRGESERRLGRLLAPHRARVLLASKFGVRFDTAGEVYYDSSPAWAREALEGSLRRLRAECIDLYQMHYWDRRTALAELFDELERLREAGKLRWYGLSNYQDCAAVPSGYPGLVSASLEYSLVARRNESAARAFLSNGLSFLSYGSLGQGLLSGKYDRTTRFSPDDRRSRAAYGNFHGTRLARNLGILEVVRACARELEVSTVQVAVAWILHRLPGSIPLVGIKTSAQLLEVAAALQLRLPQRIIAALDVVSARGGEES